MENKMNLIALKNLFNLYNDLYQSKDSGLVGINPKLCNIGGWGVHLTPEKFTEYFLLGDIEVISHLEVNDCYSDNYREVSIMWEGVRYFCLVEKAVAESYLTDK